MALSGLVALLTVRAMSTIECISLKLGNEYYWSFDRYSMISKPPAVSSGYRTRSNRLPAPSYQEGGEAFELDETGHVTHPNNVESSIVADVR